MESIYYIPNKIQAITDLAVLFEKVLEPMAVSQKVLFHINLVMDELITNIISYGYQDKKLHWIEIKIECLEEKLIISIKDDATAFDPLGRQSDGEINTPLDERSIGGLGIHFAKQFSQKIDYERTNEHNLTSLHFMKKREGEAHAT
jgi:serine/threonine-protein kinase RsbW